LCDIEIFLIFGVWVLKIHDPFQFRYLALVLFKNCRCILAYGCFLQSFSEAKIALLRTISYAYKLHLV